MAHQGHREHIMTQSYISNKVYSNDREREARVMSKRCLYQVWLSGSEISLRGPGVSEDGPADEFEMFESFEDLAIQVVLLFENGLWPKD